MRRETQTDSPQAAPSSSISPEGGLRRLAWEFFDREVELSLGAVALQALARQLLEAADVISTLRAERDEARDVVLAATRLNDAYDAWLREVTETRQKEGW